MSVHNKFIPNESAISIIESSDIFNERSDQFAIARIADGAEPHQGSEAIYEAYLRLRANVYIDQTGMLESSARREDGTEMDADDERSVHFAVVENRISRAAAIACMRLVQKTERHSSALAIEEFFPEVFNDNPAPVGSMEVSRFIVRHDEHEPRHLARTNLLMSALAHTRDQNLSPTYAVVEQEFEEHLTRIGVPVERIAEPKWVPEYNDYNLGILIDTAGMERRIGSDAVRSYLLQAGQYRYWGDVGIGVTSAGTVSGGVF